MLSETCASGPAEPEEGGVGPREARRRADCRGPALLIREQAP